MESQRVALRGRWAQVMTGNGNNLRLSLHELQQPFPGYALIVLRRVQLSEMLSKITL